jgi:DNA-binding MarR family transcriptional regulator
MTLREEVLSRVVEQGLTARAPAQPSTNGAWAAMDRQQCLDIITMLEKMRLLFDELIPGAEHDAVWNILVFLARNHLMGRPVKMSALESAAGCPITTAKRRIRHLIDRGAIVKTRLSGNRRVSYAAPSEILMDRFLECARRTSTLLPAVIRPHLVKD